MGSIFKNVTFRNCIMNSNNPILFFENLILENHFDFHIKNFFQEALDELPNAEVDKQNNVVFYYDTNTNGKTVRNSYSFNSYLRRLLRSKFRSILESLETIKNESSEIEFSKILNSINLKISYIKDYGNKSKYFDLAFAPLVELSNRINNGYFVENLEFSANEVSLPCLMIRPSYNKSFFEKLYNIVTDHFLFNDLKVNEEDFRDILTNPDCNKQLTFTVETQVVIAFFEKIKPIFIEFNAKLLEDTKRFITKRGSLITQSNYNRNKKVSSKNELEVANLTNKIHELIIESS